MTSSSRSRCLLLVVGSGLAVASTPLIAHAGWEGTDTTIVDWFGNTGLHPDLEMVIATEGVPGPTKINGLVYMDRSTGSIEYAWREVPVGETLSGALWYTQRASWELFPGSEAYRRPDLAMDPVTGRPYVVFVGTEFGSEGVWLSTFVGAGGNCGTGGQWQCEGLSTICGYESLGTVEARVELGGELGAEADVVHVIFQWIPNGLMFHARKDLVEDTWSCTVVPSAYEHRKILQSIVSWDEDDDRLKPQVSYTGALAGEIPLSHVMRTYLGPDTPLPSGWMNEQEISVLAEPIEYVEYGGASLSLVDDGLSFPKPERIWAGVPALAAVEDGVFFNSWQDEPSCVDVDGGVPPNLKYYEALDEGGTSWVGPEVITSGLACMPDLEVGRSGYPYVVYVDQETDEIMLTTRRHGPSWSTPESLAGNGSMPSMAYDYDDGTIAVAYYDVVGQALIVLDGWWAE